MLLHRRLRPTGTSRDRLQLSGDSARFPLMKGTGTQDSHGCLWIHFQTFPVNLQPSEESESNEHPELIRVRKSRFQTTSFQVVAYLHPDGFKFTGARSGEAADVLLIHSDLGQPTS